jgi:hypothetical protein
MQQEFQVKWLRVVLAYLANFIAALLGTAIIESAIWQLLGKATTFNSIVIRELTLSIVIAFCVAVSVCVRWPSRTAMWVWIAPTLLLLLRALSFAASSPGSVLTSDSHTLLVFLGLDVSAGYSTLAFRNLTLFVIPTVRTLSYSVGALLTFKLMRSKLTALAEQD